MACVRGSSSTISEGGTITAIEQTKLLPSHVKNGPSYTDSSYCKPGPNDDERTVVSKELCTARLALIMSRAWLGIFLGSADATVIATLSGPISSEFDSLNLLSWLATAYLISNAASQPIAGRLTDIFGHGPGLVFSNVVFAAGNLICGLATSQHTMIIGRLTAGIGGGGLMSIPTFLGSDLVPLRKQGLIGGIANIWFGARAVAGAAFGGFLNDYTYQGWRLAFLVQVPPSLVSAITVYFVVRVPPKQSDKAYLKRIYFGGVILTSSFLALLVLGLISEGHLTPWTHPLPIATVSFSGVVFIAFIYWERKARQPIVPVGLLLNRTVLTSCLCSVFCAAINFTSVFYVPLYLQVRGDSATAAGLKSLPLSVGTSVGALGTGYLMKRTGKYIGLVMASVKALIIGVALFTIQDDRSPSWLTCVVFLIIGAGYTAVFTIAQIACLAAVDHTYQAVVTSSTYQARSLGSTIGITIASVISQSRLRTGLWQRFAGRLDAAEQIQAILDDLTELHNLPPAWYDGVIETFMDLFRHVWLLMLAWAVLALVCIAPIKQHTLHVSLERK